MHRPTLAFCALIAAPVAFAQRPLFEALHEPLAQGGAQFAPRVLAAADFDGDGAVDALTEDGVRLGDGAGRFATIAPSSTELRSAQRAVVGDFDGDGDPDVVALRGFLGTSLLLNDGTGGLFVAGAPLPLAGHEAAVAGDFDGDGDDDVAGVASNATYPNYVAVLLAVGGGAMVDGTALLNGVPTSRVLAAGDFDGDGDDDLVVSQSTLGALRLDATPGGFVASAPLSYDATTLCGPGDFDGDGARDDLVGVGAATPGGAYQFVTMFGGAGGFAVTFAGLAPAGVLRAPTDVDGDGREEVLVMASTGATLRAVNGVVLGPPLAIFDLRPEFQNGAEITGGAYSADVDGDGDRDVLASTRAEDWRVLFAGLGGLRDPAADALSAAVAGRGAVAADLNGDGAADLLAPVAANVVGTGATLVASALNDGAGRFATALSAPLGIFGGNVLVNSSVVVADFNGDGFEDVAVVRASFAPATTSFVLLSNGVGGATVGPLPIPTGLAAYVGSTAFDVDQDGDKDVALVREAALELLINDGLGGFTHQVAATLSGGHACAPADFDGDGDLDLAVATAAGTSIFWNASGVLAPTALVPALPAATVAAGDLDGDGDADLVAGASPFLNLGAQTFSVLPPVTTLDPVQYGAQLVDVDLDGALDLIYAGAYHLALAPGVFAAGVRIAPYASAYPAGGSFYFADRPYSVADLDRDGDADLVDVTGRVFLNTTRHLARGALARPGRVASLRLYGDPFAAVDLVAAASLLPSPLALGPWGVLHLDPASVLFAAPVALDAAGFAEIGGPIPNAPSLVGLALQWQAAYPADARLSGLVTTVVEGF
jgi:hypothetical protein